MKGLTNSQIINNPSLSQGNWTSIYYNHVTNPEGFPDDLVIYNYIPKTYGDLYDRVKINFGTISGSATYNSQTASFSELPIDFYYYDYRDTYLLSEVGHFNIKLIEDVSFGKYNMTVPFSLTIKTSNEWEGYAIFEATTIAAVTTGEDPTAPTTGVGESNVDFSSKVFWIEPGKTYNTAFNSTKATSSKGWHDYYFYYRLWRYNISVNHMGNHHY